MDDALLTYGLLLVTVIAAGALLVLRARKVTTTAKSIDNAKRWSLAKPTSGGWLFALSIGLAQGLIAPLPLWCNVALGAAFAIGLIDDLWRIGPYAKLGGQAIAAIAVGFFVSSFDANGLWVVAMAAGALVMMNSINMLDNMDGVATIGGLPFAMLGALLFFSGYSASPLGIALFCGSLSFLIYNAYPSKLFMGDSGSMLLGAAAPLLMWDVQLHFPTLGWKWWAIGLFVATIPLADTVLVVLRRWQNGKSPMQGGKDHSTHHLVYFGWSQTKVMYVFTAMAIFQSLAAFGVLALGGFAWPLIAAMLCYTAVWVSFVWWVANSNLKSGKFDYASH